MGLVWGGAALVLVVRAGVVLGARVAHVIFFVVGIYGVPKGIFFGREELLVVCILKTVLLVSVAL